MPRRQILILMEHGRGISAWKARYAAGKVSEAVPYGYALNDPDWEVLFSDDAPESRVTSIVRRGLLSVLGFDLVHVFRNRQLAKSADVVWTHTEHVHLAYTFISSVLRKLPPVLCQSVWLPEELSRSPWLKRGLATWALRHSSVNVSNSSSNLRYLRSAAPGRPLIYVPFGISPEPFRDVAPLVSPEDPSAPLKVLALGNDRHRDWEKLARAAVELPEAEFRVLTRHPAPADTPPNMLFARASSFDEVLAAYEWADVVCLPLTENDHSSGITVALEATYAGRPVLMTDVGGLGSYLPTLAQFALPSAADAGMWRDRLQSFRSTARGELSKMLEAAQKDAADLELTSKGYSERLLEVTKQLLKLSPDVETTVKRAS